MNGRPAHISAYNRSFLEHPSVMASPSFKLQGRWVRHKGTGHIGYISYVARYTPQSGISHRLWIIYPAKPVNPINSISAGMAVAKEVKILRKRTPKRFAHPYTAQ